MVDPLAIWGAVTGTAGLAVAVRREVIINRRSIRVDHGWRYAPSSTTPPSLAEMYVYVMVTNTGRRDIAVEHVGWEWPVLREELPDGRRVFDAHRAELPLEEPVLLKPDGAPVKFDVNVGQLLAIGLDPLETDVWPVAFTDGGGRAWRGPAGPLAQDPPDWISPTDLRASFDALKARATTPHRHQTGLYMLHPGWADGIPILNP